MKKFLSIVLIIVFGISILPMKMISLRASAATSGTTGDCTWSLDGTVLTISGEGAMRNYYYSSDLPWGTEITEVIIEKGVTSVSTYAFFGCNSLKSIAIPDSVTGIGSYAFYNCTGLVSVIIPNSITAIGEGAFYGCTSLESITLPFVGSSRTSNGTYDAVFGYIFGYTSSNVSGTTRQYYSDDSSGYYYIPSSLKSVTITDTTQIPYGAFYNCTGLTSITIADSVTSLGDSAFEGCNLLTSMVIPDSVTSIGDSAFFRCTSLESITLPFVGSSRTTNGTVKDLFGYIFGYTSNSALGATYQVTSEYGCYCYIPSSLKSVTITDAINIPYGAFSNCTGLTNIIIPDSVTGIGKYAFYNCTGLTDIMIPDSVRTIGEAAFRGCTSLKNITLPFVGASRNANRSLDAVFGYIFGYSVSNLSGTTGQNYYSVYKNYYYIPSSLKSVTITDATHISYGAFYNCSNLTSIIICDGVTSIFEYVFYGCTGLTEITIPDSVKSIGESAFEKCTNLVSVNLSKRVISIGGSAFEECTKLKSITIPDSVTSIGEDAFYNCTGLVSVIIPNSITAIGEGAFYGCTSLESITLPFVGSSRTSNGTYDAVFGYIFGYTSNIISGTTLQYYSNKWYYYHIPSSLKSVTITDTTQIPYGAFYNCKKLKSITIPDSVTSIGEDAFYGCEGLTDVWYTGSESDSRMIDIGEYNDFLANATWHYNICNYEHTYTGCFDAICNNCDWEREIIGHVFDNDCDSTCNVCSYERKIQHSFGDDDICVLCGCLKYTLGDIDGLEGVTDADAEYLLMHTFFSEDYPVNQTCDFNGDGKVNDADAEYLLMFTFFPEDYPIN